MSALVTGVGGPAGVAVVRALQAAGEAVVGVDADPMAVGLHVADAGAVVPRRTDPAFVDELVKIAAAHGADALCSTVAEELLVLAPMADRLAAHGLAVWLPDRSAVESCVDKWVFAQCLARADVPSPATALAGPTGGPGPWIVKPRFGRGSRDIYTVVDRPKLDVFLELVPDPIVQERLTGDEFTADALTDTSGQVLAVVPRWRLETRGGISTRGTTFASEEVDRVCRAAIAAVGLEGPANVQGFVGADGAARITEINPRFSGGLPLALAAGADLVGQYFRGARGLALQPERLTWRAGVTMLRHFDEVIVE